MAQHKAKLFELCAIIIYKNQNYLRVFRNDVGVVTWAFIPYSGEPSALPNWVTEDELEQQYQNLIKGEEK